MLCCLQRKRAGRDALHAGIYQSMYIYAKAATAACPPVCPYADLCVQRGLGSRANSTLATHYICNASAMCPKPVKAKMNGKFRPLTSIAINTCQMTIRHAACRHIIERYIGCNHIRCRCGMHLCYECGTAYVGKKQQCR